MRGAVFLACPHPRNDDQEEWDKLQAILKASAKSKARNLIIDEVCAGIQHDSQDFVAAFNERPILSLFEAVESVRRKFVFRDKRLVGHPESLTITELTILFEI
jgi:hypothetical protein